MRQVHDPLFGWHCFTPPPRSAQVEPPGHSSSGVPYWLPAEQSRPQKRPPSMSMHTSPGFAQSSSVSHGRHVGSSIGRHTVGPILMYPLSHSSTSQRALPSVTTQVAVARAMAPSQLTPQPPQWSGSA